MKKIILFLIIIGSGIIFAECSGGGSGSNSGSGLNPAVEELMGYVDAARYETDLEVIAVPRVYGSAAHDTVRDFIAQRLNDLGYEVELHAYATGVNVIGRIGGTGEPEKNVLLSAHYDSKSPLDLDCPGADDNGSGVAGALEAARVLAEAKYSKTLLVAFWDEEETGMGGSKAYAARAFSGGMDIVVALVFEMIGYRSSDVNSQDAEAIKTLFPAQYAAIEANSFRGDYICVVLDQSAKSSTSGFEGYADSISLPSVILDIPDSDAAHTAFGRSDHSSFWAKGYPAVMITDTANYRYSNYHCSTGTDDGSRLDSDFSAAVIKATVGMMADLLVIR